MITALFQKGPCFTYLKLHLAICRPGGQAVWPTASCFGRQTRGREPKQRGPVGIPDPRPCSRGPLGVSGDRPCPFPLPCACCAGLSTWPEIDRPVGSTAVSLFAFSYENCIVVVVVVVTSVSPCATVVLCCRTCSFGMIAIAPGPCLGLGCVVCVILLVFCLWFWSL